LSPAILSLHTTLVAVKEIISPLSPIWETLTKISTLRVQGDPRTLRELHQIVTNLKTLPKNIIFLEAPVFALDGGALQGRDLDLLVTLSHLHELKLRGLKQDQLAYLKPRMPQTHIIAEMTLGDVILPEVLRRLNLND